MSQEKLADGSERDSTEGGTRGGRGECADAAAARVKGPLVWLDMDQKEIDDAYDQSVWASNQPHLRKRRAVWSESVRSRLKLEIVPYGPTEIEKLESTGRKFLMLPFGCSYTAAHGGAVLPRKTHTRRKCS